MNMMQNLATALSLGGFQVFTEGNDRLFVGNYVIACSLTGNVTAQNVHTAEKTKIGTMMDDALAMACTFSTLP